MASAVRTTSGSTASSPSSTGLGRRSRPAYWSTKMIEAGASATKPTYLMSQKSRLVARSLAASSTARVTLHWTRAASTTTSEVAVGLLR